VEAEDTNLVYEARKPVPSGIAERPSLLRYSPALLFVAIAIADAGRFADPDLWRHIRVGQAMIATGRIAHTDPYSYSIPGHLWRNHEWLADLVMGFFYDLGGAFGLKVLKFLCTGAVILFLGGALAETGASVLMQLGLLLACGTTLGPFLQFRPQLFSYVLLSGLMMLLARDSYRGRASISLAIPALALWANLHGGFVVGVAALFVYAGVHLALDLLRGHDLFRAKRLLAVAVVGAIATLATPYGFGTWYAVGHSVMSPAAHGAIMEWRPLPIAMVQQWHESHKTALFYLVWFVSLGALAATVAMSPEVDDWPLVAVAVMLAGSAFLSVRNMPLSFIGLLVPLACHLSRCIAGYSSIVSRQPQKASLGNQMILSGLAITMLLANGFFSANIRTTTAYPAGAVAFMQQHALGGHILNDVNWGSYLIWHLAPRSQIFIDTRFETVYPSSLIIPYLRFYANRPGYNDVLLSYRHDFVLVSATIGAFAVMMRQPNWVLIYRDRDAALFAPRDSAAAKLPGLPVTGDVANDRRFP
jgi:hypothetical protein